MFIWLTSLLTLLTFPLALIFGTPKSLMTLRKILPVGIKKRFPLSSWTPVVVLEPRGWLKRWMKKRGVNGVAFLGFMVLKKYQRCVELHEGIHILHQSSVSPVIFALAYIFDLIVYAPFHAYYPKGNWAKAPVAEGIAYSIETDPSKWQ